MKSFSLLLLLVFALSGPSLAQTDPDLEAKTADLEKVKGRFKETWVHPDADFTRYDKLYLWEATFEYRDVGPPERARSTLMNTRKREYGISDADRQKFENAVSEGFVKEISRGKRFSVVNEVGPGTMILRGSALDIVSNVPPDMVGRYEMYLSTIGEATLVLELLDASTGEVLAIASERRRLGSGRIDEFSMPANSVTVLADVRRWATGAASKLRSSLDKAIAGR